MKIFGSTDRRLNDFSSDEAFLSALQRTQNDDLTWLSPEETEELRVHIPSDPDNIFQLKMRFFDMVRGCLLPYEFPGEDLGIQSMEVPDETLNRMALLTANVQDFSSIDNWLYRLAFVTFCQSEGIIMDNMRFGELVQKHSEERERQNLTFNQELPLINISTTVKNQEIYFSEIIRELENNSTINRNSECHHPQHDEHGASEHARKFVENAFRNLFTVGDFLEQERNVLLQIQKNITSWPKSQLRYIVLWMKELRKVVNNNISEKIPDTINKEYFEILAKSDFMVDPRTLLA